MTDPRSLLAWTPWRPLLGASRDRSLPRSPGLYRIRRVGRDDLDYIGQTGLNLVQRLSMLRGVFKEEEMPYGDPHTAAPALWALRHSTTCDFEVSVTPILGSTQWRKGMEAVAIALYRQGASRSPTVEFGRMPLGYAPSSGNSARLVAAGKRFRGGVSSERLVRHEPGIAPIGPLTGDPQDSSWGGHAWSAWIPLRDPTVAMIRGSGIYRIRGDGDELLYVGQGMIGPRLGAHMRKAVIDGHEQGKLFAGQRRLECSWVRNDAWLSHQRLELENDLIAAHILTVGTVPAAQFLG